MSEESSTYIAYKYDYRGLELLLVICLIYYYIKSNNKITYRRDKDSTLSEITNLALLYRAKTLKKVEDKLNI